MPQNAPMPLPERPGRGRQRLTNFLMELHDDPETLVQFKQDPKSTIQNSKLSEVHKRLLMTGTPKAISRAVKREIGPSPEIMVIVLVVP
jgi:hypothetical protein